MPARKAPATWTRTSKIKSSIARAPKNGPIGNPDERTADEMRRRLGAEGTSDEELLLRWIVGKEDIDTMRANPRPLEYLNAEQPLVNLLQELSKRKDCNQIHFQKPGFSITLERRI